MPQRLWKVLHVRQIETLPSLGPPYKLVSPVSPKGKEVDRKEPLVSSAAGTADAT